jgi:methyl-accepting chemotaxis protein
MGQFLGATRLERLRERTEVLMFILSAEKFGESLEAADSTAILEGSVTHSSSEKSVSNFKMISDIFGKPLLVLRTDTPRDISALGARTVNVGLLFLAIAGLVLTSVVWFLLRGAILRPIEKLAKHIDTIGKSGDLTRNLNMGRDDEIGALASQFDNLTSAVFDARKALLDQSFKAGKADTAAEVLHNIRNAMTPMINGIHRLAKSCAVGETLRVAEVTTELADPNCPPERATKLLQYVDASFQRLTEVGLSSAQDLKLVATQARQIEGILADQEKFANVAPVTERLI